MSYYKMPLIFLAFMIVGGVAGWLAGPAVSRLDQRVQLALRVKAEETGQFTDLTVDTEAWRETGETPGELYDRVRDVEHTFTWGTAALGVFIGIVAACKVAGLRTVEESDIYHIHQGRCVSCTRCFRACPVEHERLKELGREETKPKL
jgi:ferredoxin